MRRKSGIPASCISVRTEAFRFRTGPPYSGTGMVPASAFLFIPVPDWLDAGQSNNTAFKKGVHHRARPYYWWWWLWKGYHGTRPNCRKWNAISLTIVDIILRVLRFLFLKPYREGCMVFSIRFSFFFLYSVQELNLRNCKRLLEFEEIEISRQSSRGDFD